MHTLADTLDSAAGAEVEPQKEGNEENDAKRNKNVPKLSCILLKNETKMNGGEICVRSYGHSEKLPSMLT